jgi:catechol 2,3-dioxygenase-like lactoylglutathione lyase family enzyme
MITAITHLTLYVRDTDEALRFYTEKLGFEKRMDSSMGPGKRWVTVGLPTQKDLELVIFDAKGWYDEEGAAKAAAQIGNQAMMIFATSDIQKAYDTLKARGVTIDSPVRELPWGKDIVFADLYGNKINLVESKPMPQS